MQKFNLHTGVVAPMDRENVDTDAIIPKQFLKSIRKTGLVPTYSTNGAIWTRAFPGKIRVPVARIPTSS